MVLGIEGAPQTTPIVIEIPSKITPGTSSVELPNDGKVVHVTNNITMPKQEGMADMIYAVGRFVFMLASTAITVMFASRQIELGSSFASIKPALDALAEIK